MPRKPKGTVTVESFQGRLRLRLPRHVFGGVQRYLTMGLADTPQNRKVAQAKAQIIEADIALENFDHSLKRYRSKYAIANDEPPLIELWEQFLTFKTKTIESTTIETTYRTVGNHIEQLPTQQLAQSKLIRKHLRDKLTANAAKKVFNYIKACCAWAFEEELISANPFQFLTLKSRSTSEEADPFTANERDQVIQAFERSQYYAYLTPFVKFCFWTGCRQSEVIALLWENISADLTTITIAEAYVLNRRKDTKTHKTRRFPVNAQLRALLLPIRQDHQNTGIVFRSLTGKYLNSNNFCRRAWSHTMAELSHIRYRRPYNTRHTFITLCLESGMTAPEIAKLVGNSPKTIYENYAGVTRSITVPEF